MHSFNRKRELERECRVFIKGAPFKLRTFDNPNHLFGERIGRRNLDRIITITLPAIEGATHKMVPTMEVVL